MIEMSLRMDSQKVVLVYRNDLLPLSETFIKHQSIALKEWRPILVGRRLATQLGLENLEVRTIGPASATFGARVSWKIAAALGHLPSRSKALLQSDHVRLLHAHFATDALDAWPVAKALRVPMLVTLHGYDINTDREWWERGNGGFKMRFYPRRVLSLARQKEVHFIAVSEALRRQAIQFGIAPEKISVQYIGIDANNFAPGPTPISRRRKDVLFVGRLVEKKGCEYLIQAMSKVCAQVPGSRAIIIGDGPLRKELEALATTLNVTAEFCGAQDSSYVKRAIDAARVFCLPSVTARNGDAEGFGLVLLEAQAAGVPVITSARGGAEEGMLDGVTGYCFPERNVAGLGHRLIELLTRDDIVDQMSARAVEYVKENFDLSKRTRELERLYDLVSQS
ncbi:hypothetical protein XI09_10180 [Bradyrhizobium sp. CCBAU 11386]|nr:hypothetical protein [Bradyrhizobium sp. CCBAU 11386]